MDKYMISYDEKMSTGFSKSIILNDGDNQYSGRLHWDSNDGYSMFWDTSAHLRQTALSLNIYLIA
jgi:hypothetical protein